MQTANADTPLPDATKNSPDERIEEALVELRAQTAADLLERLLRRTPAFSEVLVLNLLHALGYGTSRVDLASVGKSGDGGIDGIIQEGSLSDTGLGWLLDSTSSGDFHVPAKTTRHDGAT